MMEHDYLVVDFETLASFSHSFPKPRVKSLLILITIFYPALHNLLPYQMTSKNSKTLYTCNSMYL